jgi:hypothetical protein
MKPDFKTLLVNLMNASRNYQNANDLSDYYKNLPEAPEWDKAWREAEEALAADENN